ncbi:MAG: glycosyltransferase 61 family protein [Prochlorococcaceae cyanobacterium]
MSDVLLSAASGALRWSVADVVIDPWPAGSLAGPAPGGIRRFASMPGYFSERRCEQGRKRRMNRKAPETACAEPVVTCDELAYYLGPLHRHFGHAVVESSTRLWFYRQARHLSAPGEHLPVVMLPPAAGPDQLQSFVARDLADWQRSLLELYGVSPEALHFVRDPVRYRRLIVPAQAWLWGERPTRKTAAAASPPRALHPLPAGAPYGQTSTAQRVYLVRGPELFWRGAVAGESVIREFFKAHGYRLLDPVSLPLPGQLAAVRGASHVFGVQGSALHLFNLAGHDEVQVGCLGRLGVEASRRFAHSLEPFVGRFLLQPPDGADPPADPARSATKFRLALHQDVARLLAFLTAFDPGLQPDRFDRQAYLQAVSADRQRFRQGAAA